MPVRSDGGFLWGGGVERKRGGRIQGVLWKGRTTRFIEQLVLRKRKRNKSL